MVHLRINERETNPNPHVNFVNVLPMGDSTAEEAARQLLRALAAQVKPIMKTHGFVVNSLEEYEYNTVFAGRNWNNGETVELVLRSSSGSLLPTHWLLSTLCHELAHIKHMNHGPAFQTLWRQLQQEVRALQGRGYFGDGYWSSGTRLIDSAVIVGQGIETGALPEYMCGGAHSRARPFSRKRKVSRTVKKRKAGTRVNSSAFNTIGKSLNEDLEGEGKSRGTGFRKKAASKRAREERAQAAEQRIQALQASSSALVTSLATGDDDSDLDDEDHSETDFDRRRALLEVIDEKDLCALKATTLDATQDFLLPNVRVDSSTDVRSFATATGQISTVSSDATSTTRLRKKQKISQSKLEFTSHSTSEAWDCMVCTLTNQPNHLACSACGTPQGESKWAGGEQSPVSNVVM